MIRNFIRKTSAVVLVLTLALLPVTDASAFNQVHARQLAMGGAAASLFRGVETIGWNPAFLAFRDNPGFSLVLPGLTPNLGMRLSNDFLSLDQVNTYFTNGQYWTAQDKQDILNAVVGDAWDFYIDFYLPVFELSMQTRFAMLAISYDVGVSSDWRFSKEFLDVALNGNGIDNLGKLRDFSDTGLRGQAASRIGFTFARNFETAFEDVDWIDEVTFGFTASYLLGHGYFDVIQSDMTMLTDIGTFESNGLVKVVNAGVTGIGDSVNSNYFNGTGVGLDLGVGMKILDGRGTVGISVINLLNTIRYTQSQLRVYSFNTDSPLPLNGSLTNPQSFIEDNFTTVDSLSDDYGAVDVHLPTVLHLNGGYRVGKSLTLSGNFRVGLNNAVGGSKTVRAGIGMEYTGIPVLPLRLGASIGGRGGFSYGVGFGLRLGFLHTDVGWAWERGFLNSANGLYMAMNTVCYFGSNKSLESPVMRRRVQQR
ncbi:MAG: hypothetical protein V2A56_02845 [bacterium]